MIGGHAALYLAALGHEVTLAARKPIGTQSLLAGFPLILGDYSSGGIGLEDLASFDAVLFAAGNDIRHVPKGEDENEFWRRTQIDGVPAFAMLAKKAGVKRLVQLGSYYHQVMPHLAETNAYVRARKLADERTRALAGPDFNVCTLNPPSIVGAMPGASARRYQTLVEWANGGMPHVPDFAPAGGTNYMSVRSLCQAIEGALEHAQPGKAYLVGDQNLTFRAFFQLVFDVAGSNRRLEERDEEHPFLPDAFIVPGRGNVLAYEPDLQETRLLGYARHDVRAAIRDIVEQVKLAI